MTIRTTWLTLLLLVLGGAGSVSAQGSAASLTGVVARDTSGFGVAGAEIRLPELRLTTRSDSKGEFRIGGLPGGRYAISVRAVGFRPFIGSVDLVPGKALDVELALTTSAVVLDTVRSTGLRFPEVPWMLQDFESRRRAASTGQFLTDSILRHHETEKMVSLVSMFRGARIAYDLRDPTKMVLASARGGETGKPVFQSTGRSTCLVTVYVDGIQIFPAGGDAPDFGNMLVSDYSAVEYYASPSETPVQYKGTGSGCGVILLWTRQRASRQLQASDPGQIVREVHPPRLPGRILGVFDGETNAPLEGAEVTDLFVGAGARTPANGLLELSGFQSRHDSAAVRIQRSGFADTSFVIMVSPRDTVPLAVYLRKAGPQARQGTP
jgi:hypothetical protein